MYVRTADGERLVGQVPGETPENALAFYTRRFDELVFEVAPGEADAMQELVRDKMGHAVDLAVPLEVSVGTGRSWHDAAH